MQWRDSISTRHSADQEEQQGEAGWEKQGIGRLTTGRSGVWRYLWSGDIRTLCK